MRDPWAATDSFEWKGHGRCKLVGAEDGKSKHHIRAIRTLLVLELAKKPKVERELRVWSGLVHLKVGFCDPALVDEQALRLNFCVRMATRFNTTELNCRCRRIYTQDGHCHTLEYRSPVRRQGRPREGLQQTTSVVVWSTRKHPSLPVLISLLLIVRLMVGRL